jgi:hypothetical protein
MRDEADRGLPGNFRDSLQRKAQTDWFTSGHDPFGAQQDEPESLNVRLVGKWGRGGSLKVTGKDSLVFVSMGSEVAVFNCVNPHNPTIISEIQCHSITGRAIVRDTLLYVVSTGSIEVFNIRNPAQPTEISRTILGGLGDMWIVDTLAYTLGDSMRIMNIANPESLKQVGACLDSGYNIFAADGFVYLCDRWGLYVIDATNPANPHPASTVTGAQVGAVWVDSGYCYYTTVSASPNSFRIADVSDPYSPREVGYIDGIASYDLYKLSYFVYLPGFQIVDVSTPSHPAVVGSCTSGGLGLWTQSPFSYCFIAVNTDGMRVVNITDPVHPAPDTLVAGADEATDIYVDRNRAYVADQLAGTKILDISNPARPNEIGEYDTADFDNGMSGALARGVRVRDTLAYLATNYWEPANLRVVDVSSPLSPSLLGGCYTWNPPVALEVRDSLAYVAENAHFEIFSIANSQSPTLVGSCWFSGASSDLCLVDTIAYVAASSVRVINIKDPANPVIVGTIGVGGASGISTTDTIAYVATNNGLYAVDIADPANPSVISSFSEPRGCWDVAVQGHLAFLGTYRLVVVDVSDPTQMREVGYHATPTWVRKLALQDSLVYAACFNGGVCIFETTSTSAVAEASPVAPKPQAFDLMPNLAARFVDVRLEVEQSTSARNVVRFYNAAGRKVLDVPVVLDRGTQPRSQRVDISALPDGCYFVSVEPSGRGRVQKVVKTGGD